MLKTPKSLRLHIGLFGRTNVGKSSFLNMVAGQDVAITSPVPGTTTDVVEKTMELLPLGPVVFLDTAGLDDKSELSGLRISKTRKVFERSDIILLLVEPDMWTEYEDAVIGEAGKRQIPVAVVVNKSDLTQPSEGFLAGLRDKTRGYVICSSIDLENRNNYVSSLKRLLIGFLPDEFLNPLPLVGDLLPPGGLAVMVVPIDLQAPKGRLILPQVQAIRDALDNDAAVLAVKEREYGHLLKKLTVLPDLVVCDSQVVLKMVADTPPEVKCTTFSILFSRFKGDLPEAAAGAAAINALKPGDRVLIAEACSHHAIEDDIGRVKIPRWLRQYVGGELKIDVVSGKDYPRSLKGYSLVVHCGACMMNRREMLFRAGKASEEGVALTNYGLCICFLQGVIERVLSPFPAALDSFKESLKGKNFP